MSDHTDAIDPQRGLPIHTSSAMKSPAASTATLATMDDSRLSPGNNPSSSAASIVFDNRRYRPRTFPYDKHLPYLVEDEAKRDAALRHICNKLWLSLKAGDIVPGAVRWTRELQAWLNLKFEMPREQRAQLVRLYYELSLSPGLENNVADRFTRMIVGLTRQMHYLKPAEDLVLPWRPIWRDIKALVLSNELPPHQSSRRRSAKLIWRLISSCRPFFDPGERLAMLNEMLPFFSNSDMPNAYITAGCLAAMIPSRHKDQPISGMEPEDIFPTFFHIWGLVPRSKVFDIFFIDLLSYFARDYLTCNHIEFGSHGIFTSDQSNWIFTALLRLTEIPVGQSMSAYSGIDFHAGIGAYMERDQKKWPPSYLVARLIVNSLSPKALDSDGPSLLSSLEGFIQSIDTFFHPSNLGSWSGFLSQLTAYLADAFVLRWNREQSGELEVPEDRRITTELKNRFVLCLRDVTFMGIYSKGARLSNYYFSALQSLAYLCPDLILPGSLQRFYPSLQGLVEVHRTSSSLSGLLVLANTMSKQKGYRCHITALLALALPGIDANDLNKTSHTLSLIQSIGYSIPIQPLAGVGIDSPIHDTELAMQWVQSQMEIMEAEGTNVQLNYDQMSDEEEMNILRSSTAGFGEFVLALLGKVFTLLENLPDASTVRSGTPEESIINLLPSALSPIFSSLSPELFDQALHKISNFVSSHVVHQARDSMAWILSSLCRVNTEKTLKQIIPMCIASIRNEIDVNNAASDRNSGSEILPRDRALVWYITLLGQVTVYVGDEILKYQDELLELVEYMQTNCKGLPTLHISNLIHHLLFNVTTIYPKEFGLYEPSVMKRGLDVTDWGTLTTPSDLVVDWHVPSDAEIEFAIKIFETQANTATKKISSLMGPDSPIPRTGKNKEWSDEVDRLLSQTLMVISGISTLFDPKRATEANVDSDAAAAADMDAHDHASEIDVGEDEDDPLAEMDGDDGEPRLHFQYNFGYLLKRDSEAYSKIHKIRDDLGRLLSRIHRFLTDNMEDDVSCFQTLYALYRVWITDVGFERSARPLERHNRLYKTEVGSFRIPGLRKQYPRPLLIKRAEGYMLHRLRYGASVRRAGPIDKKLLLDLTESCLSVYADVRRTAQSSQESALKVLTNAKQVVIPKIVDRWREAIRSEDHARIKGGMYTLFFSPLLSSIFKDWRYAPEVVRLYIDTATIDTSSIQELGAACIYEFADFGKQVRRICNIDNKFLEPFKPEEDQSQAIQDLQGFIALRREKIEEAKAGLGLELCKRAENAHWRIASRCTLFAANLCIRFDSLAPKAFIDLTVNGSNDLHPTLRSHYSLALCTVFQMIDMRAAYDHCFINYLNEKAVNTGRVELEVDADDPDWTDNYLKQFSNPDSQYRIDSDYPGWLVWGKKVLVHEAKPPPFDNYDELERSVRDQIGTLITPEWLKTCFNYMKQEPRDQNSDRFRLSNTYLLMHVFDLMYYGRTVVKMDDVIKLIAEVYEDGSDRNQHRATSEILAALLSGSADDPEEFRKKVWTFAAPMLLKILDEDLTPENLSYWTSCVHLIIDSKDPRRAHEIFKALTSFRLDLSSNAAFKEASKIRLLEILVASAGWHFRKDAAITEDFVAHLDHPYKTVREAMGRVLAAISKTRYHESYKDVVSLLKANKATSSLGVRPYDPSEKFNSMITSVFSRLEKWRKERAPGQQTQSSYTSGSKTVLTWMEGILSSQSCTMLIPYFSQLFLDQFLHMLDVKEDPELMKTSSYVYRQLPNVPFRDGQDVEFIEALIRISTGATSWHQRLRAILNIQVFYFRRIFLIHSEQRNRIFDAISNMLEDPQLEVRQCASSTLAGMIRCSPQRIRDPLVVILKKRYQDNLRKNPMPKKKAPGTETPANSSQQIIRRHASVLGLGALVEAFPYASPPPVWMPEVLAHLATRAANDAGVVGKTTKSILSDFKKTRQDSWTVDQKSFTSEQLEDLEGVLWKTYFA
ncbi:Proteasome activator BLM10 [Ceratocystis pirilliformis]|uniref:Proteasome activator BLM10 n=1 Tax=Ceratocystis pirilliformis TaxID=259994 RepID=A0ABR3ZN35_9PEZI